MTVALCTSYYASKAWHGVGIPVRTSVGAPQWEIEGLEHVRRVTPTGLLTLMDPADFEAAYLERLDRLDVDSLAERFETVGSKLVLLCFEKDPAECHRSILAGWLEANGFGEVPELGQTTLDLGGDS